ncbi:MAG: DsrE/DsrF/TusD sulfur relay family protein [Candidatus Heimdallarchaeota archaeon]
MKVLIIINDASYGTEKAFNALRLAMTFQKQHKDVDVNLFLIADAVTCAIPNQETPDGFYNLERMLKFVIKKGGTVKACGSCLNARGLKNISLLEGVESSTMNQLTQWTYDADKVITF